MNVKGVAAIEARFLDAPDRYNAVPLAIQKGDVLTFGSMMGGIGAGWIDLTLRIGTSVKTVRLEENAPVELRNLKDIIWRIAGPDAWPPR